MYKKFPTTDFIRPKDIKSSIRNKEQKYFIAYVAYHQKDDKSIVKDIFNDVIHIDEDITPDLLSNIQDSLLIKINNTEFNTKYYATQIFNIVKI
jgi:hypothetical protein